MDLPDARVAELVDAHVSGACSERSAGSSPVPGTTKEDRKAFFFLSSIGLCLVVSSGSAMDVAKNVKITALKYTRQNRIFECSTSKEICFHARNPSEIVERRLSPNYRKGFRGTMTKQKSGKIC